MNHFSDNEIKESYHWKSFYNISGAAALTVVLVMLIEIFLTLVPGGERTEPASMTVIDWFNLFHDNWFIALRNLGLLNIIAVILGIPVFLALFAAHRRTNKAYAALAMIISFIGIAVFLATNRAFPMLDLSNRYAVATSDVQRAMLAAAGQAMLSEGQSHTPGTFPGFFLADIAGIIISIVMLRGKVFGRANAYIGIIAFVFFLIFEICSSFVPAAFNLAMVFAMIGGLLSLIWYVLIARRLFLLSRANTIHR
jgi:hypothetical protein